MHDARYGYFFIFLCPVKTFFVCKTVMPPLFVFSAPGGDGGGAGPACRFHVWHVMSPPSELMFAIGVNMGESTFLLRQNPNPAHV